MVAWTGARVNELAHVCTACTAEYRSAAELAAHLSDVHAPELVDLFPGTGIVSRSWLELSRYMAVRDGHPLLRGLFEEKLVP